MRRRTTYPTQQELQDLFDYDSDQGLLMRKHKTKGRTGLNTPEYRKLTISYVSYQHHICVWIFHNGDPGEMMVDHIDRDRHNDRIENLRMATESDNRRSSGMFKTNTSGYKGVTLEKSVGRWKAYIYLNNKRKHLGIFATKEEAAAAYQNAAKELHREFAGAFS